ncbi:hypothetical protein EJ08DRAFT_632650 [Tothia fuscella]|uniref:Uncharacterized protein n=1 Tax=Tothia fuscella TaxID=1048955 RepID=A0A9P4NU27_9PEZI|nr:hypothetical protein EJ08DRAFT_632650 [Tothia fuscella]
MPREDAHDSRREFDRSRSRSPHRLSNHQSHKRKRSRSSKPVILPLQARPLGKHDFEANRAIFALYLDMQKQMYIEDLDEREIKGRWKSFLGKWNRGELAEGWYDPATRTRANAAAQEEPPRGKRRASPTYGTNEKTQTRHSESEEDEFGPAPPSKSGGGQKAGPVIPRMEDLQYRDEILTEDQKAAREDLAYDRKQDRRVQKDRLEELIPRPDPGSRERQLEKKREVASTHASLRDEKEAGVADVPEADLLGDDGVDGFKRQKKEMERKKTERELRKEEVWRARAEERQERLTARKDKEDQTMEMFKAMAKSRFG